MHGMPLSDLGERIPHQKLIVSGREQRGGNIDQDGDPGVVHVGKRFAAEEDGSNNPRAKVTGHVG